MATELRSQSPASPRLPPSELETGPPTPTVAPATNRDHAEAAGAARAKVPKRTYGGKRAKPEGPLDRPEEGAQGQPLARHSTVIVPETDFDVVMEDGAQKAVGDHDHVASHSSSPPLSELRSTSPTSTEDNGSHKADAEVERDRRLTNSLLGNLSDESSDEDEQDTGRGVFGFYNRNGNLADQLKAIDDEADEPDPAAQTVENATVTRPSSSLPPLTNSDPQSHSHSSSQPTPSARPSSAAVAVHNYLDEDETQTVAAPTARTKRTRHRVVDSEDSNDEEANTTVLPPRASHAPRRSNVISSSDDEDNLNPDSPYRTAPSAPAPSRQERIAALAAAKRKAAMPVAVSPPRRRKDDALSDIETSSDADEHKSTDKTKRAKKPSAKPKIKGLSKKEAEEMHKQSASFAREQEARLEPSTRNLFKVADILKRGPSTAPPAGPRNASRLASNVVVLSSSSDAIVDASSSPGQEPSRLSAKALGKQREQSPIRFDRDATPQARKQVHITRPLLSNKTTRAAEKESSSDEEDLLSLAEYDAKKQREKEEKEREKADRAEKRKARQAKLKAHREAREKEGVPPDSDAEIELEIRGPRERSPSRGGVSTLRPGSHLDHVYREVAHVDAVHHEDATDSQMQRAGKEFGRQLIEAHHHIPSPSANKSKNRSGPSKASNSSVVRPEDMNQRLIAKSKLQALKGNIAKRSNYRQQQLAQTDAAPKEPERTNVQDLFKKKERREAQEADVDEDADDPDYEIGSDEEEANGSADDGDEAGSGSDAPEPPKKVSELEEGDFDSDGELAMPASSQNLDRSATRDAEHSQDEAEDDEDDLPISRRTTSKPRVIIDDEDEDGEPDAKLQVPTLPATEATPIVENATAPARIALDVFGGGADDGGGFSQFFNSQFSQAVAGDNDGEGFARAAEPSPFGNVAPSMFVAEPLISTAERAADAALLEARGGIHNVEPGTPRAAAIPRQYINKQGFMTQTRPVGLFADSPTFSPRDSQAFQNSLSTGRDSQSQRFTQTQIDATPTQAARHPNQLRRQAALVRNDSLSETQPDPTEVVDEEEESFPSAAQPPTAATQKNAFDVLRQGGALAAIPERPAVPKRGREKNAYVVEEADLDSDEEQERGLGAASGDEDEEGHDAELENLVDNEAISEELQLEQDARADELYQIDQAKKDAADLKRAEGIAAGKERTKRRNGLEIDDVDFDDEYQRREAREKRQRVEDKKMAELLAHKDTEMFAKSFQTEASASADGLFEPQEQFGPQVPHEEDDGDDADDPYGGHAVKTRSDRTEAFDRQRIMDEVLSDSQEIEMRLDAMEYGVHSSSPVPAFKTKNRSYPETSRAVAPQTLKDDFAHIEDQYSVGKVESHHSVINYKAGDYREDSTASGNGISAGGKSAVTSFRNKAPLGSKSSASSTSLKSTRKDSSSSSLGSKSGSKISNYRKKNGFAA